LDQFISALVREQSSQIFGERSESKINKSKRLQVIGFGDFLPTQKEGNSRLKKSVHYRPSIKYVLLMVDISVKYWVILSPLSPDFQKNDPRLESSIHRGLQRVVSELKQPNVVVLRILRKG
jgi:hypothetical protein